MKQIIIRGGKPLKGKVKISGAKNAALPILAAAILTDKKSIVRNVPHLKDIDTFSRLLATLGANVREKDKNRVSVDSSKINNFEAPYELVKTMRAGILVLGPMLARFGKAKVSTPGGCSIGVRPIDI
ncbi:MAG: UDP-N-acetylglucosamine 1-carboxyvinyltransferase, partial [Nitrospinota bacterium]|nr:UDP-N-acetylglucosamine 1-carboxyvinyltransferase [Nitrospinota bacterium]